MVRMKTRRAVKKVHPFLKERKVKELFIVVRVDDYSTHPNQRGGFPPGLGQYLGKGGMLWPDEAKAQAAAAWVLSKPENKDKTYAVCKVVTLVSNVPVKTPVKVEKV